MAEACYSTDAACASCTNIGGIFDCHLCRQRPKRVTAATLSYWRSETSNRKFAIVLQPTCPLLVTAPSLPNQDQTIPSRPVQGVPMAGSGFYTAYGQRPLPNSPDTHKADQPPLRAGCGP